MYVCFKKTNTAALQRLEYGAIVRDDIQDPVLFSFESDVDRQNGNRPPTSEQCVIRGISSEGVCTPPPHPLISLGE
jgi:hypothetical protein